MKKNLTKVMAMGMVMTILAGTTAFANEAVATSETTVEAAAVKEAAGYLTQSGKVVSVEASGTEGVSIVTIDNEQGGLRFAVSDNTILIDRIDGFYRTVDQIEEGMTVSVVYDMNSPMGMSLPAYLGDVTAVVVNSDFSSFAVGHFDEELTDMNIRLQLNIDNSRTPITTLQGTKIRLSDADVKGQDALVFYDNTTRSIPAQTTPSFVLLLTQEQIAEDVTEVEQVAMVPLRDAAEAKGYTVTWQGKQKPVLLTKGSTTMEITVGSDTYVVDGDMVMKAAMPSELKNGVTFVCADIFE